MNHITRDQMKKETGGRIVSLDLLRCLAMMMIIVLHFLGKGDHLTELTDPAPMKAADVMAWVLECLCLVAVDLYMLLSGYLLTGSRFRPTRLFSLWAQVWLFSVLVGFGGICFGLVPQEKITVNFLLTLLLPVSMDQYWFMTAYVCLFLLLPLLLPGLERLDRKQMYFTVGALVFFFCILKSVLPVRLEADGIGYDALWYVCMFVLGACFRKFPPKLFTNRLHCLLLYFGGCALCFAEMMIFHAVYLHTGRFGLLLKVSAEYNHLFLVMASIGLFGCFLGDPERRGRSRISGKAAGWIAFLSAHTLGVYLLHENISVRYVWQELFCPAGNAAGPGRLLAGVLAAVVCLFVLGICADLIRELLQKGLGRLADLCPPGRRIRELGKRMDEWFRKETA